MKTLTRISVPDTGWVELEHESLNAATTSLSCSMAMGATNAELIVDGTQRPDLLVAMLQTVVKIRPDLDPRRRYVSQERRETGSGSSPGASSTRPADIPPEPDGELPGGTKNDTSPDGST